MRGHDEKRHLHANGPHQGELFGLKQWPGVVFEELKCYSKINIRSNKGKEAYAEFTIGTGPKETNLLFQLFLEPLRLLIGKGDPSRHLPAQLPLQGSV